MRGTGGQNAERQQIDPPLVKQLEKLRSLARAIVFSALATGSAFGALWISDHPGTASMGLILMISLIWTLICALIFEPALLGPPEREPAEGSAPRTRETVSAS